MRYKKYIFAQMTEDKKEYRDKKKIIVIVPDDYEIEKQIGIWLEDKDLI